MVVGACGDRRQVRHAEHLAARRRGGELLRDHRRHPAADAGIHLVEDHRRHAVGLREHALEREHRPRQLAAGGHACERPRLLAGVRRQAELDPVEPAGPALVERAALERNAEHGPLHPEGPHLTLGLRPEPFGGRPPPLRERAGRLAELAMELAERALLRGQDLLVAREAVELRGDLLPEAEHRLFGVAVLALQAREDVEALVDRLEPPRLDRDRLPQRPDPRERLLDLDARGLQRLHGSGERRVQARQVLEDARGAVHARGCRALLLVEEPRGLHETRQEPLGVLGAPARLTELRFLAGPEPRAVELGELEAQEVFALRAVALRRARALDLGVGRSVFGDERSDALAQVLGVGEAVEQLELTGRLQEPLVLVLAVDLDELVAEALEEPDGDGRVVDEGAVASASGELPPHDELAVLEREPSLVERGRDGPPRLDLEDGLDRGGLGLRADHVGLGAGAPEQEDRVDQHRLAGARLAGQHVEAGPERHGHALDHGEVPDPQLAQHRDRC